MLILITLFFRSPPPNDEKASEREIYADLMEWTNVSSSHVLIFLTHPTSVAALPPGIVVEYGALLYI